MSKTYKTFQEFYPFYLSQHQDKTCRRLHYIGSSCVLGVIGYSVVTQAWLQLLWLPIIGYGFAWVGHFVFEKNKPATFEYPLYSLVADWVMFWQMLTCRLRIKNR